MPSVTPVPSSWKECDNLGGTSVTTTVVTVVPACSLTIYVDFEGVAFAACRGGWPLAVGMDKDIALDQAFDYLDAVEQRDIQNLRKLTPPE